MDKLMEEILNAVADGYDSVRPGAGDCVREKIAADAVLQNDPDVREDGIVIHLDTPPPTETFNGSDPNSLRPVSQR